MIWVATVTDRTQRDVEEALSKLAEWREWISVGLVPETQELKGCLNVSDLNRIENNLGYLIELVKGFDPEETEINDYVKTDWSVADIPNISDIERILGTLRDIRVKYDIPLSQTPVPDTMLHFDDVNRVEENLNLLRFKLFEVAQSISEAFPLWFELEVHTWGDIENYTWETLVNIREGE
jgi:hypothetical protein